VDDILSAFTGTEIRFAINANHMEMCRYSSKDDDAEEGLPLVAYFVRILRKVSEKKMLRSINSVSGRHADFMSEY